MTTLSFNDLLNFRRLDIRAEIVDAGEHHLESMVTPSLVAQLCRSLVACDQEYLWWLGVDTQKQLVAAAPVGLGTVDACIASPREIVQRSLLAPSVQGVFIVHNHPSGSPLPSEADSQLFKTVREALQLVGLSLLDSLILARDGYWSERDRRVCSWPPSADVVCSRGAAAEVVGS